MAKARQWSPPLAPLAVFVVAAVALGFRLGAPGLIEPDEARYAAVGQEMVADRDFVTPRFNGFAYLDKPPLLHWTTAGAIALFGPREFAVRLVSMLAAAAGVALTYVFGRHVYGHRAGLAAALVLLSCVMWFIVGHVIRYDLLLALSITAAIWWGWLGSELGRDGRRYYILAAIAMGLGVLVKGPVAVALPLVVLLPYLALTRRLAALKEVPWLWCIGVFAAIVVPWFALCERANPGALRFFLLHENLARAQGETDPAHWRPAWYFVGVLVGAVSPWTLFLPGALIDGQGGTRHGEAPHRRACTLWIVWVVAIVALFSIPKVKLATYILPALPPVALLIGRHISPVRRRGRWSALLTGLLLVAGAYGMMTLGTKELGKEGIPTQALVPALVAVWLLGGLAALLFAAFQQRKVAVVAIALTAMATYHLGLWATQMIPESPSDLGLTRMVGELRQPGEEIVCVRKLSRGTIFYLNTRVAVFGNTPAEYDFPGNEARLANWVYPLEDARRVLAKGPPRLIVCRHRYLDEFTEAAGDSAQVVAAVGRHVILRSVPVTPKREPAGDGE